MDKIKCYLILTLGLLNSLEQAMRDRACGNVIAPQVAHQKLSQMYQWTDVASRTEQVYNLVMNEPEDDLSSRLMK